MATYPTLVTSLGSEQQPVDDLTFDVWPNGSVRAQSFFTGSRTEWKLVHRLITSAQLTTLKNFYAANKTIVFDYLSPFDSVTYTNVVFISRLEVQKEAGDYWTVTVQIRQQ